MTCIVNRVLTANWFGGENKSERSGSDGRICGGNVGSPLWNCNLLARPRAEDGVRPCWGAKGAPQLGWVPTGENDTGLRAAGVAVHGYSLLQCRWSVRLG